MAKKSTVVHGRQISKLKRDAIAANPDGSDEDIARGLNAKAEKEGLTTQTGKPFSFTPEDIKATRSGGKPKAKGNGRRKPARSVNHAAPAPASSAPDAGTPFMDQLSGLVGMLGKDGVKKLVDDL